MSVSDYFDDSEDLSEGMIRDPRDRIVELDELISSLERNSRLVHQDFKVPVKAEDLAPHCSCKLIQQNVYNLPDSKTFVDKDSVLYSCKHAFFASLDVQNFTLEEIQVKVLDHNVVVEGKHEEKPDRHGLISRHFIRRYVLPGDCNMSEVISTLSSDGVLSIFAPRYEKPDKQECHPNFSNWELDALKKQED